MPISPEALLTLLFKGMTLIAVAVYVVFATVVVRQVYLMTQTLRVGFETPIKIIAWAHLFFALIVLLLSFFAI